MAATVIGRRAEGRGGEERDDYTGEIREIYRVRTNDRKDGVLTVLSAPGLPQMFAPYVTTNEFHFGLRCNGRRATQVDGSPWEWDVECSFATLARDEEEQNPNPTLRPPEVSFGVEIERYSPSPGVPVQAVPNADAIMFDDFFGNSAGMPFEPQPEIDRGIPYLTIVVNRLTVDPQQIFTYSNSVNSDFFMGAEPRTLKMDGANVSRQYENGLKFWSIEWRMKYRFETWDLQLLDIGPYYLSGSNRIPFLDDHKNSRMGLLDGAGAALGANADAVFRRWEVYRKLPFGALGIERIL